jgi:hypothetical protein
LSQLAREIEEAAARFGEIAVAVGAINGTWLSLSGVSLHTEADEPVAVLSCGDGAFFRAPPVTSADLRGMIENFIADHGDMAVAVADRVGLHTFIDINVDTDVDDAGDDISVMIVQAYVMKASPKLVP